MKKTLFAIVLCSSLSPCLAATAVFDSFGSMNPVVLDGSQSNHKYTPPTADKNDPNTYVSTGSSNSSSEFEGHNSALALQISSIQQTVGTDKQFIASFDTAGSSYNNLFGVAYTYTGTDLTLYFGGFSEGWKSVTIADFSSDSALSIFFDFNMSNTVTSPWSFSVDGGTIQSGGDFTAGFRFGQSYISSITLGGINTVNGDSATTTWASNNANGGAIGAHQNGTFTLDYIAGYNGTLSAQEKQNLALRAIPEPSTAALGLLGLGLALIRRRRAS